MEFQEGICNLCLEKCESFKAIDGNIKNVFDKLLLKIDFTVLEEPAVCKNCAEMLMKGFDFKTTCLRIHDYVVTFVNRKSNDKLDLKNIYLNRVITGSGVLEDQDICVLCMGLVKKYFTISFGVEDGDVTLKEMIEQCLPELDLNIFKKPVICATCYGSVEKCFQFVKNCLVVEEKTKKCSETLDIDNKSEIELSSSLQFTMSDLTTSEVDDIIKIEEHFSDDIKNPNDIEIGNGAEIIKLEHILFDESTGADEDVENKNEIITEMDDQKVYKEDEVTSKNLLVCEDSNKLGFIKKEEIFYDNNETKQQEDNFVEMEDQKFLLDEEIEIKTDDHDFSRFEDDILPHPEIITRLRENPKCSKSNNAGDLSKVAAFKCDYCSYQTNQKKNLNRHLLVHKDPSELIMHKCDSCPFQTKRKDYLRVHLLIHKDQLEVTMYECDSCSFQTKRKDHLKRHMQKHKDPSDVTIYKCHSCSFETKLKCHLETHLLEHKRSSEQIMYRCDSCSFQTKRKYYLKIHLLIHKHPSEVTMYECDSCSFQTKRKNQLKKHSQKHKDPSAVTMYKCECCSYKTRHKGYLKTHVLLKHKDPSEVTMYKCESCLYETRHRFQLKRHYLTHKDPSEVTMHKCNYCSFQTKHVSALKKHLQNHKTPSEVTMHRCDHCPYQTKHVGALKRHLQKHKNPPELTMHRCDHCPYQTKLKRNLRTHVKFHREMPLYKCDHCSFQTKFKGALRQHILNGKIHRKVPVYNCDHCSYETKHKICWLKHREVVHKISEITVTSPKEVLAHVGTSAPSSNNPESSQCTNAN